MADITLADYTGYIYLEIIKAREMADRYARQLAEVYAADPVLKFFSVPRFKVPKMSLTIPVLISGARFNQVISFKMAQDQFVAYAEGRLKEVVNALRSKSGGVIFRPLPLPKLPVPVPAAAPGDGPAAVPALVGGTKAGTKAGAGIVGDGAQSLSQRAAALWQQLKDNPDPSQPASLVRDGWAQLFEQALTEAGLVEVYKKLNPNDEMFTQSLNDVLGVVTTNTMVDSTTIQSLLINPETNVVKNGSSDTSVFTISAELLEEGFFIRSVTDEATGEVRPVVEFE